MYYVSGRTKNSQTKMKRFDFRTKLKGLDLNALNRLRDYHLDLMLMFVEIDDKEADKQLRYLGYIDDRIKKLEQ